jgi:hypothetical protein
VIASNLLGEAYVVPLIATLGQIKEFFHTEDVSLPETLDFKGLQIFEEASREQTLINDSGGLTALPSSYVSNTPSINMMSLATEWSYAKQSSISEVFFRVCDASSPTFCDVRISHPELIRRYSLVLGTLLDERNTDRYIVLKIDPQTDFDISEVAWVIENLQLPGLEAIYQKDDPKGLARICAVIWTYQCDPNSFKDLKIMIRPRSYLPSDSTSILTVAATTRDSRCWQRKSDITNCGHLITTAFVLGSWGILEDEIMVAVWGTSKEVKVLANLGIDIGGK